MFLEVTYETGETGRYPLTPQSTVTISEPDYEKVKGARRAFSLLRATSVTLQEGEIEDELPENAGPADGDSTSTRVLAYPETHKALDDLADRLGITWPAPPEGKRGLKVADKIAALQAAGIRADGTRFPGTGPDAQ